MAGWDPGADEVCGKRPACPSRGGGDDRGERANLLMVELFGGCVTDVGLKVVLCMTLKSLS